MAPKCQGQFIEQANYLLRDFVGSLGRSVCRMELRKCDVPKPRPVGDSVGAIDAHGGLNPECRVLGGRDPE